MIKRMKAILARGISFMVALVLIFTVAGGSPEARAEIKRGPAQKFARGMVHVIASPFQIPKEMIQTTADAEPFYLAPWKGLVAGGGSGVYYAGRQLISGFWDFFTFWTPAGRDWGPLFESSSLVPEV